MGAANIIPGVSGGTIAFITGIYERLINAIKSCGPHAAKLLFSGKFKEFAEHVDLRFLAAIAIGAVAAIAALAKVLTWAFDHHQVPTWAFFFGLILAWIWGVGKMVERWGAGTAVALLIGGGIAVGLLFVPQQSSNDAVIYLFLCGIAAISSMIIPGLSGSFVLLVMGNYKLILGAVNNLDIALLIPFALGCVAGLVVLSHFLAWIFKHHHDIAVALITGFIIGSLVLIWPWKDTVYQTSESGAYMVKTESREVVEREGDLPTVRKGLAEGEELITVRYTNWKLGFH